MEWTPRTQAKSCSKRENSDKNVSPEWISAFGHKRVGLSKHGFNLRANKTLHSFFFITSKIVFYMFAESIRLIRFCKSLL